MASRTANITITGIKPLVKTLQQLPEKSRKKVIKSAVSRGSTPVVKAAKKLVPLGSGLKPDGTPRDHLRKTITKTAAKVYPNGSVVVTIGPRFRAAPHSHLVDRGTKPHAITMTKAWGHVAAGTTLQHPGSKAAHFMDNAIATVGNKSQHIIETAIAKGIEKEAAKLAGKK